MSKQRTRIVLLAGETKRARTYAQQLERFSKVYANLEIVGVFFGQGLRLCPDSVINDATYQYFESFNIFIPDLNEPIDETFDRNGWVYHKVRSDDVNSDELLDLLTQYSKDVIVFAGYGGQILSSLHFSNGTKYLHMHPGSLPDERGSTTIFYSILNKRNCTVTSFWMTERLDDGEVLNKEQYITPKSGVDLDGWFDHLIRGDCFYSTLHKYLSGELKAESYNGREQEEYYVVHPVLKHIALMNLK